MRNDHLPHDSTHESPFLTTKEAAKYLRCCKKFLRTLLSLGAIPHLRIGRKKILIPLKELETWYRENLLSPTYIIIGKKKILVPLKQIEAWYRKTNKNSTMHEEE